MAVCGLLAFLADPAGVETDAARAGGAITRSLHLMRHRGPDEPGGLFDPDADGAVVFGFNRLSFIDIAHSHQPLRWGRPRRPTAMSWSSTARSTTTSSYATN